jgi:glucose dehydrogenase
MAYSVRLNVGGLFLTSLPQRLAVPAAGTQGLIVDVFSTFPSYDVTSNDDWIYVSVDRNLDRIFVDVGHSDVDRVGEILIIAENDTSRVFVWQGSSVSVQKSEELAVILFPNPSTDGIFYLQSDGGEMQLDVFDMMGRNLWSRRTFSTGEKIDLSRQRNGMYFLRIIKNGQQKTFRLIKQ